jgi:uncharacterized protein (DUF427 family)
MMSTRLRDVLMREFDELRYEPTDKRIRGRLGDATVVDSTRALLVWEPKRVVPTYAVPLEDVTADIAAAPVTAEAPPPDAPRLGARPVLDPRVPFRVHTVPGEALTVRAAGGRQAEAFRPTDPDLRDYVILDFAGFDAWFEEDEPNVGHPRDPFQRIDILHGSRQVRIEAGGQVLAESSRPYLLFEPPLPVRYYLALEDVRTDLLEPSDTRTYCAYKGRASYWSFAGEDVAWTYREPLREAAEITGRIAFFDERVDVLVDGMRRERPVTPWSRR